MKKGLFLIGIVLIGVAVYFFFFNKTSQPEEEKPAAPPLAQGKNSAAFNIPFNDVLQDYYGLQGALVEWDTAKASASAKALQASLAKVPHDSLKADPGLILTAKSYSGNINADCVGIAGDSSISEKRKSFYELSENLHTLLQTVRYDQQKLYYMVCPMAFGTGKEGKWISNTNTVVNPYLGLKHPKFNATMVNCGSIEDSVDYQAK